MKGLASNQRRHKELIMKIMDIAGVLPFKLLLSLTRLTPSLLNTLITQLQREKKLIRSMEWVALSEEALENRREGIVEAMWVFDDFFQRIDYFTAGDYPAIVCFFADGVDYEIIYVPVGQEYIISKSVTSCDNPPKRLVTIENTDQIPKISIPNITAYCITEPSGKTNYYKRKEE